MLRAFVFIGHVSPLILARRRCSVASLTFAPPSRYNLRLLPPEPLR